MRVNLKHATLAYIQPVLGDVVACVWIAAGSHLKTETILSPSLSTVEVPLCKAVKSQLLQWRIQIVSCSTTHLFNANPPWPVLFTKSACTGYTGSTGGFMARLHLPKSEVVT